MPDIIWHGEGIIRNRVKALIADGGFHRPNRSGRLVSGRLLSREIHRLGSKRAGAEATMQQALEREIRIFFGDASMALDLYAIQSAAAI